MSTTRREIPAHQVREGMVLDLGGTYGEVHVRHVAPTAPGHTAWDLWVDRTDGAPLPMRGLYALQPGQTVTQVQHDTHTPRYTVEVVSPRQIRPGDRVLLDGAPVTVEGVELDDPDTPLHYVITYGTTTGDVEGWARRRLAGQHVLRILTDDQEVAL